MLSKRVTDDEFPDHPMCWEEEEINQEKCKEKRARPPDATANRHQSLDFPSRRSRGTAPSHHHPFHSFIISSWPLLFISIIELCVSAPPPNIFISYPHVGGGRQVQGHELIFAATTVPPGRRVGFRTCLEFFLLCKKNISQVFVLPRPLRSSLNVSAASQFPSGCTAVKIASPAPSVRRPAPNHVCTRRERKSI